jgi:hypothetical protein
MALDRSPRDYVPCLAYVLTCVILIAAWILLLGWS